MLPQCCLPPIGAGEPVLNQLSFYIVLAVLLDTMLIRAIVVPCLMAMLGSV